jgi:hypothetical protein
MVILVMERVGARDWAMEAVERMTYAHGRCLAGEGVAAWLIKQVLARF